jgi:hypothetical protein
MVRECLAVVLALGAPGCSLVLDFSENAVPGDAAVDSAFAQAECDFGEPNDTADTATTLAVTDTGPAAICGDDRDFFKFTVPDATASVTIQVNFASSATGDLDLRLFDKTGATQLAGSFSFGDGETITCPGAAPMCDALAPDDYVFEVFPAISGAQNRYEIALTLTAM